MTCSYLALFFVVEQTIDGDILVVVNNQSIDALLFEAQKYYLCSSHGENDQNIFRILHTE